MLFSFVNFSEGSSISNSSEVMNGDIFCRGKDEIFVIKNDPQCSNQDCKRKNHTNINMKHRHRLYASARQMEEDVSKHLLKDAPHGDQVIFRNVCFIAKINNFTVMELDITFHNFQIFPKLLELINACTKTLHNKHSLVMSLKERFVIRPTKGKYWNIIKYLNLAAITGHYDK